MSKTPRPPQWDHNWTTGEGGGLKLRFRSGRRDSNPRHSAWEADTLPTELHPLGTSEVARLARCRKTDCESEPCEGVGRSVGPQRGPAGAGGSGHVSRFRPLTDAEPHGHSNVTAGDRGGAEAADARLRNPRAPSEGTALGHGVHTGVRGRRSSSPRFMWPAERFVPRSIWWFEVGSCGCPRRTGVLWGLDRCASTAEAVMPVAGGRRGSCRGPVAYGPLVDHA